MSEEPGGPDGSFEERLKADQAAARVDRTDVLLVFEERCEEDDKAAERLG